MYVALSGHTFRFEIENICRLFFPQEKIVVTESDQMPQNGLRVYTLLQKRPADTLISCRVVWDDFDQTEQKVLDLVDNGQRDYLDRCELEMVTLLYHLFVKLTGLIMDWGILTGVRPVKLLRRLVAELGEEGARRYFTDTLLVKDHKFSLCLETLRHENEILALSEDRSFSLYISIPFCPTRCDYCSFVSRTIQRAGRLIPEYVELLAREIAYTGQIARDLGLKLETVYFGGGTPTSLSAEQLAVLLQAVEQHFDLSTLREYTVEAGRPDTVTAEKLEVIRRFGVNRISINPQTLQPHVLQAIGRQHTVEQFFEAFALARDAGFAVINTDLIAGLPLDTLETFLDTLERIVSLSPENITVHTLSMKRASNLVLQNRSDYRFQDEAVQMVAWSVQQLPKAGYHPYYLYRQSRTMGNQENVGWAKKGNDGLYNVYIMDETHTILGCGAGAVTKLKQPGTEYLERIFNYKFPYEYNARFSEMISRKGKVYQFYEQNVFGKKFTEG